MSLDDVVIDNLFSVLCLDKKGGALDITQEAGMAFEPGKKIYWIHIPREDEGLKNWLDSTFELSSVIKESLFQDDSRPHVVHLSDGILLNLRGLNFNPGADLEDMVSIRIWMSSSMVVTTSKLPLMAVHDLKKGFFEKRGPKTVGDFITQLVKHLHDRINRVITDLEDSTDQIEEDDGVDFKSARLFLKKNKMSALKIRRYIVPQKEALEQLVYEKISLFSDHNKNYLRQYASHLTRFIENIDFIRDRTKIIHDELAIESAEKLNRNMYILSIIAAVFLPLGFLTGLFGINVAGIPGTTNPLAFYYFSAFVVCVGIVLFLMFKVRKWL